LLLLFNLFVLLIVSTLLFSFNPIFTEESHFFKDISPGLDDRRVWNKVDALVFLKESFDIYDFCLETLENFLLENCKKAA
jgi:hypothetical protein